MNIKSIYDVDFSKYGRVVNGYNNDKFVRVLEDCTPLTENVQYVPSDVCLENLVDKKSIQNNLYGGMPVQIGWCNGYNTKLNCFEYHRDSEINLGTEDFILLLAKESEITDGKLNTSCVKAFLCPAGVMVEIYATTLHYAPCQAKKGVGFRVMIVLPKGTNTECPDIKILNDEDKMLWAKNKWLIAHKDSAEAEQGAYIGLVGENTDIKDLIKE